MFRTTILFGKFVQSLKRKKLNDYKMEQAMISIVMPMYNARPYIKECIESILCQNYTNFELLIGDDGSTDGSEELVASFHDRRIRLFRFEHDYIATCNKLLKAAKGKYIARMDADDVMLPDRLAYQYEFMEHHPEIDILGCSMQCFGENDSLYKNTLGRISCHELFEYCCVAHPTVFARREALETHQLSFREAYAFAEDYDLWAQALACGLSIFNTDKIVVKYRICGSQISRNHSEEQCRRSRKVQENIARLLHQTTEREIACSQPVNTDSKLTVVIPFFNEGEEVARTVQSIRSHGGEDVCVIVVNDASTDGFPYRESLRGLHVHYIENKQRIGAGGAKEKGIQCVTSPYFLVLDAHMRFYQDDWVDILLAELRANNGRLLCCQSKALKKEGNEVINDNKVTTYGAFIYFGLRSFIPSAVWNTNPRLNYLKEDYIPCVLGACYASSKAYWNKLNGLKGLLGYGSEEPYISMKAWLEGGRCKLIRGITIGHIYKRSLTDFHMHAEYVYNFLFIAEMLFPTSLKCRVHAVAMQQNKDTYQKSLILLSVAKDRIAEMRRDFMKTVSGNISLEEIIKVNSALGLPAVQYLEQCLLSVNQIEKNSRGKETKGYGLFDGKAALMVLEGLIYVYEKDTIRLERCYSILDEIKTNLDIDKLPLSFPNGVQGIGWAMMYLTDVGTLKISDVSDALLKIDEMVSVLNVDALPDLETVLWLSVYCSARLGFCKRYGLMHRLHKGLIDNLVKRDKEIAEDSSHWNMDIRMLSVLLLMASYDRPSWSTMKLDIQEILNLPTFLPREEKYWTYGLTGSTGYAVNLMATQLRTNEV